MGVQIDLSELNSAFVQQVRASLTPVVIISGDGSIQCRMGLESPYANSIPDVIFPWIGSQVEDK